jgi:hypothetical protein
METVGGRADTGITRPMLLPSEGTAMNTPRTAVRLLSLTLAAVLTLSVMWSLDALAVPDAAAPQLACAVVRAPA